MSFRWTPHSRRSNHSRRASTTPQGRRLTALECLEDRTLLSSTIPLNSNTWTSIGPIGVTNTASFGGFQGTGGPASGRITGIAPDPTSSNTIYVGTAGGGVWRSVNAGQNWSPLTDQEKTLFIGSIAVSPSNPQVIYAGTGEANSSTDSFQGKGVLKSTDGGTTWALTGSAPFDRKTIGKIVVDPTSSNFVYAAVSANGVNSTAGGTGIYKSVDGGTTWTNTTASITTADTWSDLVINRTNPQVLYAAVGTSTGSGVNGVYKSVNGGQSWAPAGNFPINAANGRIALAISRSNPQEVIASVSDTESAGAGLRFLELSTDGGTTWNPLTVPNYLGSRGNYANVVAISPTSATTLYAAGSVNGGNANGIVESTDRGQTWTDITVDSQSIEPHTASHALAFDSLGRLLDGNDGGIWRLQTSAPASFQWADINGDLAITQFNSVALDPSTPNVAFGGAQAQGTSKFNDNPVWTMIQGGDGGHVAVDPGNPQTVYYESTGISLTRSLNGGPTGVPIVTGINPADLTAAYAPFVIDPSNTSHLLFGTTRIYTTTNKGTSWTPLTTPFTRGFNDSAPIVTIAIAKSDPKTIFAATQSGKVFVSVDAGVNWTQSVIPTAGDSINQIIVDPVNAKVAYAVRNKFDGAGGVGHVFETINAGASWVDISGNLPDMPAWSVAVDDAANRVYVGTDAGVYATTDGGTTWSVFKTGLPNVQVMSLEFSPTLNILIAGTHGRGAYEITGVQSLTVTPAPFTAQEGKALDLSLPIGEFTDSTLPAPPLNSYSATISWGDATTSTSNSVALLPDGKLGVFAPHTYAEEGVYPLFVSVVSSGGKSGNVLSSVNVTDGPLTALPGAASVSASEGVPFTGTVGSFLDSNPAGTPDDFTISINWGDGSSSPGTAVAAPAPAPAGTFNVVGTHTYDSTRIGRFTTISYTIRDVGGASTPTVFSTATVQDAPLSPVLPAATFNVVAGATFSKVIASFSDADTTAAANYYSVTVDWGDNSSSSFARGSGAVVANGGQFDVFASHAYAARGTYNVAANVTDFGPNGLFFGSTTSITATAAVTAGTIASAAGTTIASTEGQTFTGRVATFTASNRLATVADFQAPMINWGDNTAATAGTIVALGTNTGKFAVTASHLYRDERATPYTFTVTLAPVGSAVTTTATGTATIGDAPITATAIPQTGVAGDALQNVKVATFLDSNPLATVVDFGAGIDWGDGTTTTGVVGQPGGIGTPFVVTGTHTYANGQTFPITVRVFDVGGMSDSVSTSAVIAEGPFRVSGVTLAPITEGGSFTGTVGTLIPDNPNALAGEFLAVINYGDGSSEQGKLTSLKNGTFAISSPNGHVYAEEGDYSITVTVLGISAGVTLSATSPVTVTDAPIVASPAVALQGVAGTSVSGVVASFSEYAQAPLSDFSATILWGDGTSSVGVVSRSTVVPGTFDVSGSHVYQVPGLSFSPEVEVSDVGGSRATLTGAVSLTDPPITSVSYPITAVQGRPFSGLVATFTEPNLFATAGEFRATIRWGDNTPDTAGSVGGSGGTFSVTGSHTFNTVAAATPVTVTIVHVIPGGGGSRTTSTGFAHVLALLSGALSPASDSGPSNHDGITRVTTPVFQGKADPGAMVTLFAAPANNQAARTLIGTVVASASGVWTIRSRTLGDGVYAITASETDTKTGLVAQTVPVSTGASTGALVIATSGPTVSNVVLDPATATLHVIFQTGPAGIYLGGLLNTRNYVFSAINSAGTLTALAPNGITAANLGGGKVQSNLRYNGGSALANGGYVIVLHAAGLIDLAGNILVEKNFVTFPQTTNSPNPDYVAQINVTSGRASAPIPYVSLAEQKAAADYLKWINGRLVIRVPHQPVKPAAFLFR